LLSTILVCGLFSERASAQFQNPITAAKDAYNKAKAQQQGQKPAAPATPQTAGTPAQSETAAAAQPAGTPAQAATSTAAPGVQIPAAPAGGIDPSKLPDIQGIHLGMTAQEMLPKLKTLYPGPGTGTSVPGVYQVKVQYLHAPDTPWIGQIVANFNPCEKLSLNCSDQLYVTFSAPPSKEVAVYLKRSLTSQNGKFPTADTIIAGLKQKYGANPVMLDANTLAWGFDENGQPLTPGPGKPQPPCRTSRTLSPDHSIDAYPANAMSLQSKDLKYWITMKCGLAVNVVAQLTVVNTGNGAMTVAGFDVTMTEDGEDMRDALAGEQYIENVNKAAQQQQLKNAQQQKVPTL
jgi:hypothetical protein